MATRDERRTYNAVRKGDPYELARLEREIVSKHGEGHWHTLLFYAHERVDRWLYKVQTGRA